MSVQSPDPDLSNLGARSGVGGRVCCALNGLRPGGWQVGVQEPRDDFATFHMVAVRDVQTNEGVTIMEFLLVPQLVLASEWSRAWERSGKQAVADAMLKWAGDHLDLTHDLHVPFVEVHKAFALHDLGDTSDECSAAYDGEGLRDPDGFYQFRLPLSRLEDVKPVSVRHNARAVGRTYYHEAFVSTLLVERQELQQFNSQSLIRGMRMVGESWESLEEGPTDALINAAFEVYHSTCRTLSTLRCPTFNLHQSETTDTEANTQSDSGGDSPGESYGKESEVAQHAVRRTEVIDLTFSE
jgi:hypothetical protein